MVILISVILCSCTNSNKNNENACMNSINLSTQYEKSYRITLDKNKTLHTYVFENQNNEYTSHKSIELMQEEYDNLIRQVETLGEFTVNSDSAVYDYWTVNLKINSNDYVFTYGLADNKNYDSLVENMIRLSTIKIIDSSGNNVLPFQYEE